MNGSRRTFAVLDGLRGLAALLVVFHHEHLAGILGAPAGAYLAVDLFFLMSGFVIAYAYEARLANGLSALEFMRLRLIRLYPLYGLGTLIGLGVAIAFWRLSAFHPTSPAELVRAVFGAVVLSPTFSADPTVMTFPLNGPAWSLFFELFANLLYAVVGVKLSNRALTWVCGVCAAAMAWLVLRGNDLNVGYQTLSFVWGLPRVCLSFFGGVLLYRLHASGRLPRLTASPLWALAVAMFLLGSPFVSKPAALAAVVVGFPAVLLLAICSAEPPRGLAGPMRVVGEASYPLYAIHGPLVVGLMYASRFWGWDLPSVRLQVGVALPFTLAIAALVLSRAYDQPVRRWLAGRGTVRETLVPVRS